MSTSLEELSVYLRESRGDWIVEAEIAWGELNVTTTAENYIALLTFLRDDPRCQFVSFIDICGVDYPQREQRFDVSAAPSLAAWSIVHGFARLAIDGVFGTDDGAAERAAETMLPHVLDHLQV